MHERFLLSRPRFHYICPNPRATCGVSFNLQLLSNTDGAASERMTWSLHCIEFICTSSGKRHLPAGFLTGSASLALISSLPLTNLENLSLVIPLLFLLSLHTAGLMLTLRPGKRKITPRGTSPRCIIELFTSLLDDSQSTVAMLDVEGVCLFCRMHNTTRCSEWYQQATTR